MKEEISKIDESSTAKLQQHQDSENNEQQGSSCFLSATNLHIEQP